MDPKINSELASIPLLYPSFAAATNDSGKFDLGSISPTFYAHQNAPFQLMELQIATKK